MFSAIVSQLVAGLPEKMPFRPSVAYLNSAYEISTQPSVQNAGGFCIVLKIIRS